MHRAPTFFKPVTRNLKLITHYCILFTIFLYALRYLLYSEIRFARLVPVKTGIRDTYLSS